MSELFFMLLGWIFTALPFVMAFAMALGLVLLVVGMFASPIVGAAALLLLFLVETASVYLYALKLGITVYPQDLLFVPMALVALLRLQRADTVARLPVSLWVLVGVMSVSFIWGLLKNGTSAGVEFRNDFYFMVGIFYFASFNWTREQVARMLNWLFPVAALILLVVWYRWLADSTGLDWVEPLWRFADTTGVPLRVINAQQSWLLGLAVILLVYAMFMDKALAAWRFMLPFLVLTVLVLQHRTVWLATLIPVLMVFAVVRLNREKLAGRLLVLLALTAVVLVPLLATGQFKTATGSVADLAAKATSTTSGTHIARIQGWDALLKQWMASGPRAWVMGDPYGSGFRRSEGSAGREVVYAPHNYYVQLLLRVGVVGLLAFFAFILYLFRGAIRLAARPYDDFTGYAMLGVLMSFVLYNIPYSPTYTQGLFIGVILGLILHHRTLPAAKPGVAGRQPLHAAGA